MVATARTALRSVSVRVSRAIQREVVVSVEQEGSVKTAAKVSSEPEQ